MKTLAEVIKAFPAARRLDYRGFILVAFKSDSGEWCGRGWRGSDWKPFAFDFRGVSAEEVFSQYKSKIDTLKQLLQI